MRVAVFFEGAGGATEGIRQAGHETVGYEYWQTAVDTARANGHDCRLHDLSDPARDGEIVDADAAWFSPPCQPFSAAGEGEGEFDDRDGLPWVLRILDAKRYPVIFLENVKGLTFAKHAEYVGRFLLALSELGYAWEWKVLNAADYGVPQTRERWILVARLDGAPITWPMPTHTEQPGMFTEPWVTMAQALGWGMTDRPFYCVPTAGGKRGGMDEMVGGSGARRGLYAERNAGRWLLNTRTLRGIVDPEAEAAPRLTTVPAQWCWERPATTVAGDPRVMAPGRHDPEQSGSQMADAIRLTIPELAALQGFPPDYVFTGTKTARAKQVGNAVPPALARVVVEANLPSVREVAA